VGVNAREGRTAILRQWVQLLISMSNRRNKWNKTGDSKNIMTANTVCLDAECDQEFIPHEFWSVPKFVW
jgi:hypothetical protein